MGWFVTAIIFWLIALVCLAIMPFAKEVKTDSYSKETKNLRPVFGVIASILLVIGFGSFFLSGLKSVPTKNIGIPIIFGKVSGSVYGPGIHQTWTPWLGLEDISKRVQTTTFEVDGDRGGLPVRIGGQQTARLDVTIQWQVRDAAAEQLFLDYGAAGAADVMADIQNAVVVRSLQQVENQVMGDYNPIQDVSLHSTAGNSQFSTFGPKVQEAMTHDIGGRVQVLKVLQPLAHYDDSTQARLNTIQQQYAETAIAKQQYNTNVAQARANDALRKSVQSDPNVLRAICLNLVRDAMKTNYQLPAGFICLGSSNVAVLGK